MDLQRHNRHAEERLSPDNPNMRSVQEQVRARRYLDGLLLLSPEGPRSRRSHG